MKPKTSHSLIITLVLTVCFLAQVHAVDDAEFEALEKQIEQIEADEKKKKADAIEKKKAEAEKKRLAEEAEKQRLAELEKLKLEEERKRLALEEQLIKDTEEQKRIEIERKRKEEERIRNEEKNKKELEEKRKQEELIKFKSNIISYKKMTWFLSGVDYAIANDLEFEVGMGDAMFGYGFSGIEFEDSKTLVIKVSAPSSYQDFDANSFAGFVVDYFDGKKYTKRVLFSIGMLNKSRWDFGVPKWGKNQKPDGYYDLGLNSVYRLNIEKWAPDNWNGRAIFAIGIQNAGHKNTIKAEIIESIN